MPQSFPPQPLKHGALLAPHRVLQIALFALITLFFACLIIWEVVRVTAPPELAIISPEDNFLSSSHQVLLEGNTSPGTAVSVNDTPVAVSVNGSFKETLDLRIGLNIITIRASRKFAKPNVIYRRVVVSE